MERPFEDKRLIGPIFTLSGCNPVLVVETDTDDMSERMRDDIQFDIEQEITSGGNVDVSRKLLGRVIITVEITGRQQAFSPQDYAEMEQIIREYGSGGRKLSTPERSMGKRLEDVEPFGVERVYISAQ